MSDLAASRRRRNRAARAGVALGVLGLVSSFAATAATGAGASPRATGHQHPLHVYRTHLTRTEIARLSKDPTHRVIVLLRDQHSDLLGGGNATLARRADVLRSAEAPIVDELSTLKVPHLVRYDFINAVSATMSTGEISRLRTNPAVRAVVADHVVHMSPSAAKATDSTIRAAAATNPTKGICGTSKNPLLEPEGLSKMAVPAAQKFVKGGGVKVAVFPDGLDPNIKNYIRKDGTHAIFDYRDFTGDGPNGVTGGEEAFGDASSIIAQGRVTYNLSGHVNPAVPLPKNCDIKIKGVAPNARLAVMKIFGTGDAFDGQILRGLDWAVSHDHVDVLSESFGGNPVPNPGTDPVSVFDAEAVAHGISVVASSGDAGVTNTIGSPATASAAKGIIATAATTDFRLYAQVSGYGYNLFNKGYVSNNVSSFSSSGYTDAGLKTVDVTAPGEGGWADCSTNLDRFPECADIYNGKHPQPIVAFGGTSQSCPLTAGVVALVIEAYRHAHGGTTPSPALVKRIITSSATDLGIGAENQGAGQVNALRAVRLARSLPYHGKAHRRGTSLLYSTGRIAETDAVNSAHTAHVTVTNESSSAKTLKPAVQRFGPKQTIKSDTVNYDPTSTQTRTFPYFTTGAPEPYVEESFHVPSGYQRLLSRIAWKADNANDGTTVRATLFDGKNRMVADTRPQGAPGGFNQNEVRNPAPGTWHLLLFSTTFDPATPLYKGPIAYTVTVQKTVTYHTVTPSSARLAPGASKTFAVHYVTPASAGDAAGSIVFGADGGVIPLLTRSVMRPTAHTPATFSGELTGGNARMPFYGQELPFKIGVPSGQRDIDVDVRVADPGYEVLGFLVDPAGVPQDVESSTFIDQTTVDNNGNNPTTDYQTLHLTWRNPVAGRWTLDLATVNGESSVKTSSRVNGTVAFNTVNVSSSGVPSGSASIAAGSGAIAHVKVKNTGNSPEIYFVDPRLDDSTSQYSLGFLNSPNGVLPGTSVPQAVVPPYSSSFTMVAKADRKVIIESSPAFGSPDVVSPASTVAAATYSAPDVPASEWGCGVTLDGPFSHAVSTNFSCAAFATTRTIDDNVQATGGNLWDTATDADSANGYDPEHAVVVPPGGTTTIDVAFFVPAGTQAGTTVKGSLAVQTFNANTLSGDDLVHIPYAYKVKASA